MIEWRPDVVVFHGGCDDGFGAAWSIWQRWPNAEFVPGYYNRALPEVSGKDVLFVDFSVKKAQLPELMQQAKSVVILDHHKSAMEDLDGFRVSFDRPLSDLPAYLPSIFRDLWQMDRPAVAAFFDMESSGAVMAWDFAVGIERNDPPPNILSYIQDVDLWRFLYGDDSRQFSAALRTYPQDFEVWDGLARRVDGLIAEGATVLRANRVNVQKIIAFAYEHELMGFRIPVVNAPYLYASECGAALLEKYPDAPFAGTWFRRDDGLIQWSLRSELHRQDVAAIAVQLGGGGHRNAAGFEVPGHAG